MADRINPGIGGHGPLERRLATLERFFSRIAKIRILTNQPEGGLLNLEVLAIREGPGKEVAATAGAFFGVTKVKGKWMLQGGQVGAGSKSEVVKPIELAKVGSEPKDDQLHWLQITGDGLVTTGRLQGTFNMTKVTDAKGATMPPLTLPTKDAPKGRNCYVLLGSWQGKRFQPSQTGYIGITFCPGQGYSIHRGT